MPRCFINCMGYVTLLLLSLQKLLLPCLIIFFQNYWSCNLSHLYCHTSNIIYNFRGSTHFLETARYEYCSHKEVVNNFLLKGILPWIPPWIMVFIVWKMWKGAWCPLYTHMEKNVNLQKRHIYTYSGSRLFPWNFLYFPLKHFSFETWIVV